MLHTFPNDAEIVEAVHEFLLGEVAVVAAPELAFKARIAANLLAALGREIAEGPEPERQFVASLEDLDVDSEHELARRIGSGSQDVNKQLLTILREVTEARVRTWNPNYLNVVDDDDPRRPAPE